MQRCTKMIRELAIAGVLADQCTHHVTGHSLGGSLANLVAGSALIVRPPAHYHARFPIAPDVISFNAPGIGEMEYVSESQFHQGQVVNIRAKYDVVSTIGTPYGYVINNDVPEGRGMAKPLLFYKAKTGTAGFAQDIIQKGCDDVIGCNSVEDAIEAIDIFGLSNNTPCIICCR